MLCLLSHRLTNEDELGDHQKQFLLTIFTYFEISLQWKDTRFAEYVLLNVIFNSCNKIESMNDDIGFSFA
jgi:hypothetical protein